MTFSLTLNDNNPNSFGIYLIVVLANEIGSTENISLNNLYVLKKNRF